MTLTLAYEDTLSRVRVTATALPAGTVTALVERRPSDGVRWETVRGGLDVPVTAGEILVPLDDYEFAADEFNTYRLTAHDAAGVVLDQAEAEILPNLGGRPWLKVVARPFLNRPVTILDAGDVERPARAGVHHVVGRSFPVVVSDVRGSRSFELQLVTEGDAARRDMDYTLASGEPIFLHVPAGCDVAGGYFYVGTTRERQPSRRSERRLFLLPLTEIAPPAADIVGASVTWQSVLNSYATWQDVLDAHATWGDLLELIGDPADVIVP